MDVESFRSTEGSRPAAGRLDVSTTLQDFAIVTFDVDPQRLGELLPSGFEPDVVTLGDGRSRALVSAVTFQDRDFAFRFAPWARLRMVQANYRAYITHKGRRGVWFFGTTLTSAFAALPRLAWRMPWYRVRARLSATWGGETLLSYSYRADGWGSAELELSPSTGPLGRLDGFDDAGTTATVLTHPLVGYYARHGGGIGTYAVWHELLRPSVAGATASRFGVFERLGLTSHDQQPHSVIVQPSTDFVVLLPPRRVPDSEA